MLTYFVAHGRETQERRVCYQFFFFLVVELPSTETMVGFSAFQTHRIIQRSFVAVKLSSETLGDTNRTFTLTVNGTWGDATPPLETTWIFAEITAGLSFVSSYVALFYAGAVFIEITLPSGHTDLSIDGFETIIGISGITAVIVTTDATSVIVVMPEVVRPTVIPGKTVIFTVMTGSIVKANIGEDKFIRGIFTYQTINGDYDADANKGKLRVVKSIFTATLPANGGNLYLYAPIPIHTTVLGKITTLVKTKVPLPHVGLS